MIGAPPLSIPDIAEKVRRALYHVERRDVKAAAALIAEVVAYFDTLTDADKELISLGFDAHIKSSRQ